MVETPTLRQVEQRNGVVAWVAVQEGAAHADPADASREIARREHDVPEAGVLLRPGIGDRSLDARAKRIVEHGPRRFVGKLEADRGNVVRLAALHAQMARRRR